MLENAAPLATLEQAKMGLSKMQSEPDAIMHKYSTDGLIGLDPVALAHQLCIIDLGMLKEIRCSAHSLVRMMSKSLVVARSTQM